MHYFLFLSVQAYVLPESSSVYRKNHPDARSPSFISGGRTKAAVLHKELDAVNVGQVTLR